MNKTKLITGTAEKEFECWKFIHKCRILHKKMTQYYKDMEEGSVNIPDFLRDDRPEDKATIAVMELLNKDREQFESLYQRAYEELEAVVE